MNSTVNPWQRFRDQMPVTDRWVYLDNAAVAPLSRPALEAISRWSREAAEEGDTVWGSWNERVEQARQRAARMLGADTDEVAFVANTTSGISLVSEGLPWRDGDNVVILDNEFPTNVYPWLNLASRGVETRQVPTNDGVVDLNRLADSIDARTRLVSISWVGYATGWRVDVGDVVELAHARNVFVLLDAIQGAGVFPLDVHQTKVDFLAADGHKWMLGPEGAGLFYARREHLSLLRPFNVGWNSVVHSHDYACLDFNLRPTAARYEGGSLNMVGVLALGASLELLLEAGLSSTESSVADRVLEISDLACRRLSAIGAKIISHRDGPHRSGIVAFDMPGCSPSALRARCRDAGVVLSCRGSHLRISPHAYTDEADVDRLVEVLAASAKKAQA